MRKTFKTQTQLLSRSRTHGLKEQGPYLSVCGKHLVQNLNLVSINTFHNVSSIDFCVSFFFFFENKAVFSVCNVLFEVLSSSVNQENKLWKELVQIQGFSLSFPPRGNALGLSQVATEEYM